MTRVIHLIESGGIGGAESVFLELAKRIDKSRFTLHNVLMRPGWLQAQFQRADLPFALFESRRRLDLGFVWRLRQFALNTGAALFHSHLPDANAYAVSAARLAGLPVIATYHGMIGSPAAQGRSERIKLGLVRRHAQMVIAVSSPLRNQLVVSDGFAPDRVRVVHNGVDWRVFDAAASKRKVQEELGLKPGGILIGMVGNMRPAKGYSYFVRAAAIVLKEQPEAQFLIVGETENSICATLEAESTALGIRNHLHILGARDDVPRLLAALDVFVLSSLSEGMSIATVEAMGAGLPVVVTRCGGPEDLVEDGISGLLVPPADESALAAKTLMLLRDSDLAARIGARARVDARRRFDITGMVRSYECLYEELVGAD